MNLRREQFVTAANASRKIFVRDMVTHLRDRLAAQRARRGIADGQIELLVCEGMESAAAHGVEYHDDVQFYLECCVMLGPKFDRDPASAWAGNILQQRGWTGTRKMTAIREYLVFQEGEVP